MKTLWLLAAQASATASCLQRKMDTWCQNLGTDDHVFIIGESHHCNHVKFARFDTWGQSWRCFQNLLDSTDFSCVDQFGEMVACNAGDHNSGKHCTRNLGLKALIASGCPGQPAQVPLTWGSCGDGIWSSWVNRDTPEHTYNDHLEFLDIENKDNEKLVHRKDFRSCPNAVAVEARVVKTGATQTHQKVYIGADGFECINDEQKMENWSKRCLDYEARYCCKGTDKISSLKWNSCLGGKWSSWNNRGYSNFQDEVLHLRDDADSLCKNPIAVEARVVETGATQTHQYVHLSSVGLSCYNRENIQKCFDYEARFCCPEPDNDECSDVSCPACSTCKVKSVDTFLEFRRSTQGHSSSESPLTLNFLLGGQTVLQQTYMNIMRSPDNKLHTMNLGETGVWDSVRIEHGGSDGASFEVFRFLVGEFEQDIVAARGCRYLWLDLPEDGQTLECYNESVFQVETFLLQTDSAANWQRAKCEADDECKCVPGNDESCSSDKVCSGTDCDFTVLECPENSTMTDKYQCKTKDGYKCFPGDDQSCEDDQTCEGVNCLFAIPVVIEDCNDSTCKLCLSCKDEPVETILEYQRNRQGNSMSNNGLILTFMRGENVLFEQTYTDILNSNNEVHKRNLGKIGAWDNVRIRLDGNDGASLDVFKFKVGGYTLDIVEARGCSSLWLDSCDDCGLPGYEIGLDCYYESVFQDKTFYLATHSVESASWRTFQCEDNGECGDLNCAVKAADDFRFETYFKTVKDSTLKITGSIRGTLMVAHYNLGTFTKTEDGISMFEGGHKCSHGKPRRSEIIWSCGAKNEIISASEPSLCVYSIVGTVVCNPKCKDDKFKYDKDPEVILEKRAARLAKFMDENLSAHSNFIVRINKKVEKVVDRMVLKFKRLNERCDLWSDPDEDADTARYDEHNPCKAAKQLTTGFVKWSTIYNLNCNAETTNKMLQSVERNMAKVEEMLKKKIKNC